MPRNIESAANSPSFDALSQELYGLHAIEASAGTGKTYAITLLWLRLVCEEGMAVESILVSTFTRAATAELRDRLRQGLYAAEAAISDADQAPGDIGRMLRRCLQGSEQRAALSQEVLHKRLRQALSDFDLAPITTIHGFCSALIARHCLELSADPDARLVESSTLTLERMVVDTLVREASFSDAVVDDCVQTAQILAQEAALKDEQLDLPPAYRDGNGSCWKQARQALLEQAQLDHINPKQTKDKAQKIVQIIQDLSILRSDSLGLLSGSNWFTEKQAEAVAQQAPAFFRACEQARKVASELQNHLWRSLVTRVRQEYPALKARQGERGFDDLLITVLRALEAENQEDARPGEQLAHSLRQRFQAVMVDECQDSDAVQIQVFRRLFAGQQPGTTASPTRCFLVIGDPKQSIYRFRGADLSSYRSLSAMAHKAAEMTINWRSDGPLITAIDRLYQAHHASFADSVSGSPIPYIAVQASPDHQQARIQDPGLESASDQAGSNTAALICIWSEEDQARSAKADIVGQCADECQRLLAGTLRIEDRQSGQWRSLQADDIAIIAGTRSDLNSLRMALRQRGIPSQFSGRGLGSVLNSDEARDLQIWLSCLAACEAGGGHILPHLIAWWASPLMAGSASDCHDLANNPIRQADLAASCRQQAAALQRLGPLPVLLRLLNDPERIQRCLQAQGGERLVTNWRHVADLLQGAWAQRAQAVRNAAGCAEALYELMAEARYNPDANIEGLETDLPAIQLVTTHGSKGLEYPITFCPFLWQKKSRSHRCARMRVAIARRPNATRLALRGAESFDEQQQIALAQEDEEEQRLLYVAITRARHRCYIGMAAVREGNSSHQNGAERSALARLLGLSRVNEENEIIDSLDPAIWRSQIESQLFILPPSSQQEKGRRPGMGRREEGSPDLPVLMPIPLDWSQYVAPRKSSFSGLSRSSTHEVLQNRDEDEPLLIHKEAGLFAACGDGVELGNRVHNILEEVLGNRRELDAVLPQLDMQKNPQAAQRQEDLRQAMTTVLHMPLQLRGEIAPSSLYQRRNQAFAEMHFLLTVEDLSPDALTRALLQDPGIIDDDKRRAWAEQIAEWSFPRLRGFLQGFIDLTLRDQLGRWWVVDYKTNQLPAYDHDSCEESMLHSDYLLQGRLYLLALHRHLRHHLSDYDPSQHLGGCAYAYVRGFDLHDPGMGLWQDLVDPVAIYALDDCFQASHSTALGASR